MLLSVLALLFLAAQTAPTNSSPLYYLVCLRPDPARKTLAKTDADRIQSAHMANIGKMAKDGILVAAGPFGDTPTTISGIFLFRVSSLEDARRIAEQDPTVVEHRNTVDVHPWRGPAGIGDEYFKLHKEHPETPEGMGIQPLFLYFRGPSWDKLASVMPAHIEFVTRLRNEGKLAAGGPTENDDRLAGVLIFKRIPPEEAQKLVETDPAVKSGVMKPELHLWYCADHVLPW